jgi:hypothetical protein
MLAGVPLRGWPAEPMIFKTRCKSIDRRITDDATCERIAKAVSLAWN